MTDELKIEDGWFDVPVAIDSEPELTPRQKKLRDGVAGPTLYEGEARLRRLERLTREMTACQEFVEDMDRILEHTKTAPVINHLALRMSMHKLQKLKQRALTSKDNLDKELRYLRSYK